MLELGRRQIGVVGVGRLHVAEVIGVAGVRGVVGVRGMLVLDIGVVGVGIGVLGNVAGIHRGRVEIFGIVIPVVPPRPLNVSMALITRFSVVTMSKHVLTLKVIVPPVQLDVRSFRSLQPSLNLLKSSPTPSPEHITLKTSSISIKVETTTVGRRPPKNASVVTVRIVMRITYLLLFRNRSVSHLNVDMNGMT